MGAISRVFSIAISLLSFPSLVLSLLMFFITNAGNAQSNAITIQEIKVLTAEKGSESGCTLIFYSTDSLLFQIGMNKLSPIKDQPGKYKVTVNSSIEGINLSNQDGHFLKMSFVQDDMDENAYHFRSLKPGEIRAFQVSPAFQLEIVESIGDDQMVHSRAEALFVFKTGQKSSKLSFESKGENQSNIIRVKDSTSIYGRYWVYLKPGTMSLTVKSTKYSPSTLKFAPLESYPVKYFTVKEPDTLNSYFIETIPGGALITIEGLNQFNEEENRTPYLLNLKCGTYGITLSHEDYETVTDEITICGYGKNSSLYKLNAQYSNITINLKPELSKTRIYLDDQKLEPDWGNTFRLKKEFIELVLVSPTYKTDTLWLDVSKDTTIDYKMKKFTGDGVGLITNPGKVKVTIDDIYSVHARSPVYAKLSPGNYRLRIENPLYEQHEESIEVTAGNQYFSFNLKPKNYQMLLKVKGAVRENYQVFLDGNFIGDLDSKNIFNKSVPAGIHQLQIQTYSSRVVFNSPIDHDDKVKQKTIWLPSKAAWSAISAGYILPVSYFSDGLQDKFKDPTIYKQGDFSLGVSSFSIFGLTLTPLLVETTNTPEFPEKPYLFSWINPEYRMGVSLTNWLDVSLFFNAYYKNNILFERKSGKESTEIDIRGYKYGMAFNIFTHNRYRWSWFSVTLKAGIRDDQVKYGVWNGTTDLEDMKVTDYNAFVSINLNFFTIGDGMILRLFKKPLSHAGAF